MNKLKTLLSKITIIKVLSTVFMGFGIGIIAFAAYSIWSQSNYSVKAVPSHISKPITKGVGHFTQSVLPGEKDNCVLSGHRDTVFGKIGNLKIGDQLIVQTSAGIFTYKVKSTRIVHKDDKTVIVHTSKANLTLTTCYPFNFIGDAPDRYIVFANLINSK
ncbi:sortase [Clostridium frigoris]|uniref:Sortase n=1 Tax=Clostridium frigoris TaxID=205327 RepID=A0ABS6BVJ4_9CLOT|nr:sortase [Clostridium frigoris]MBU3160349.1 sortase [Clostridium frigoris]